MVIHVKHAPRALLRLEKDASRFINVRKKYGTDRHSQRNNSHRQQHFVSDFNSTIHYVISVECGFHTARAE